jgi:uncharacterized integral membrane protein
MQKWKVVTITVLVVLAIIVMLQNMNQVPTKLLFVTITMPHAIWLLFSIGVGFVAGFIAATLFHRQSKGVRPRAV